MDRGNSDLYRINLDGTGLTQLTFDEDQEEEPAWSPDGLKLLYEYGREVEATLKSGRWTGMEAIPFN